MFCENLDITKRKFLYLLLVYVLTFLAIEYIQYIQYIAGLSVATKAAVYAMLCI